MAHEMIFFENMILGTAFDEEEEPEEEEGEEGEVAIDDELLGELGDDMLEDDDLLAAEIDPLLKLKEETGFGEAEDLEKDPATIFEEDEEDEEDMDYDSFDDKDEM